MDKEQTVARIMEEMQPAIQRANQSSRDHAAQIDAELQEAMRVICEKHGLKAEIAGLGIPGPKLLQIWSDFLMDRKVDREWFGGRSEDGRVTEGSPQTAAELVIGVTGLLNEVAREFPDDEASVQAAKLRLAAKLLNELNVRMAVNHAWISHRVQER